MEEKFNKEELENHMNKITLEKYILATPFSTGDQKSSFDRILNEKIFFEHLYFNSEKADNLLRDINRNIEYGYNNIILSGYKGCGKTTFVNYFINKNKLSRNRIINFDNYVEKDNDIKSTLLLYFYKLVDDDYYLNNCEVIKEIYKIYYLHDNDRFFNRNVDSTGVINEYICWIEKLISESNNKTRKALINENLKQILNNMSVIHLLILVILFDLTERLIKNLLPKCNIIFDNLDIFFNNKELSEFTRDISIFRTDISYILDNITIDNVTRAGYNPFQEYTLIFCMRETTKCEFVEHFADRGMEPYVTNEISKIYDKEKIIFKRQQFLEKIKNNPSFKNSVLVKKFDDFVCLLKDDYISNNIFSLFNDDFRTSVRVLAKIIDDMYEYNENCIEKIKSLRQISSTDNWNTHASRCILFRKIFNLFMEQEYFDRIKKSEYQLDVTNEEKKAINATRIILLYLKNSKTYYYAYNNTALNSSVSFYNLLRDLTKFIKSDITINTVWDLFELRRLSYWNHLVTFDGLSEITYEKLNEQKNKFENGNFKYSDYCKINITEAGEFYIDNLLPHYEYFASRVMPKSCSLFELSAEQLLDFNNLENIMSNVFNEVKDCCIKLLNFYNTVFVNKFHYSDREYLGSKFCWHKYYEDEKSVISMFHSERIIHSHIGYLNDFRMYVFNSHIDDKSKIFLNSLIISYIEQYINLISETDKKVHYALSSKHSKYLIKLYKRCIAKIKKNIYNDFTTNIDSKTGKEIMSSNG